MKHLLAVICLGVALSLLTFERWAPETNLLDILPSVESDEGFQAAQEEHLDRLSRKLVFVVSHSEWGVLEQDAKSFQAHLKKWGGLNLTDNDFSNLKGLGIKLTSIRSQLLDSEWMQLVSQERADQIGNQALASVYSLFGGVSGSTILSDPLGIVSRYFSKKLSDTKFKVRDGLLVVDQDNQSHVVILAELDASQNNLLSHSDLVAHIKDWKATSRLSFTGYPFYSDAGAKQGKSEFTTIGVVSIFGVILLLLWAYKSSIPLLSGISLIFLSYWIAYTSTLLIFETVHIFTLVIGASLIGISIDYALHFFSQSLGSSYFDGREIAAKIRGPILISFMSTILGFSCLLFMPFEVLKQSAVFFTVGLSTSVFVVLNVFPLLKLQSRNIPVFFKILNEKSMQVSSLVVVGLFILGLVLLFIVNFDDDVRALQSTNQELKSQEYQIKDLTGAPRYSHYFVVRAKTQEQLLLEEEKFVAQISEDHSYSIRSISSWVPSLQTQKKSYELYKELYPQENKVLEAIGARTKALKPAPFELLKLDEWLPQLPNSISNLWIGVQKNNYYSIVEVGADEVQLPSFELASVRLLSQAEQVSDVLKKLRVKIAWSGLLALFIVAGFLTLLMGPRKALRVLSPPVVSAVLAIGLSFLFFGPLNLFNVLAVYLVVALGLDYAVFYSEKSGTKDLSTYVGIHMSMFTSMLSFGLLSLSSTAAISGFGITLGLGLLACFFLCPYSAEDSKA